MPTPQGIGTAWWSGAPRQILNGEALCGEARPGAARALSSAGITGP